MDVAGILYGRKSDGMLERIIFFYLGYNFGVRRDHVAFIDQI